jgi:hypothetical protein
MDEGRGMDWQGCRRWIYLLAVGGLLVAIEGAPVEAADDPIVVVSQSGLTPHRLEVHLGERVRWRASGGQPLRLELDPHRGAHEVIVKQGEIQAIFLQSGEHWYRGAVVNNGETPFRGVVVVREAGDSIELPAVCRPESSDRVCFMP